MKQSQYKEYDYFAGHCGKWQPSPSEEPLHRRSLWNIFGKYVPKDKTRDVLDIGCGTGQWLMTLSEHGYRAIEGVEVSPHQCQVCRDRGLPVKLVENTVEFLTNTPQKYALITMFDVLEHVSKEEQIHLLTAIKNALIKDGVFVCTVPNANSIVASRWRYIDWTHEMSFTEDSLEYVMFCAGFSNIHIAEHGGTPRMPWLLRPGILKYYWRCYLRWKYRCLLYAEIGSQAWRIPLSYNLVGIGAR